MIAAVLALAAAVGYGVSDFLSGSASRTVHYGRIALVAQSVMVLVTWTAVWAVPGEQSVGVVGWGLLAGVGASLGTVLLYRGLGAGQMNVVAPLSAATAALVPVAFGIIAGERPSWIVMSGVLLVIPAIWMISSGERQPGEDRRLRKGAGDGLLAGVAFAVSYIALDQAPVGGGLWAAAYTQLAALIVIASAVLLVIRPCPNPRSCGADLRRAYLAAAGAGLLGAVAVAAFLLATGYGLLVVTSVLTSLYPAVTVLLARVLLAEQTSRIQLIGLGVAAAGVVLVATG